MTQFDTWLSPAQRTAINAAACPSSFTSVKFMTADEKKKVLDHWRKLMTWLATNGVPHEMPKAFTKVIYQHLTTHAADFIAHYDIHGFWHAQLGTPEGAIAFFNGLEGNLLRRWGALSDYADVNSAMMDAAREVRPGILRCLAHDDQTAARAAIALLARRAGFAPGMDIATVTSVAVAGAVATTAACDVATPATALAPKASTTPIIRMAQTSEAQAELF